MVKEWARVTASGMRSKRQANNMCLPFGTKLHVGCHSCDDNWLFVNVKGVRFEWFAQRDQNDFDVTTETKSQTSRGSVEGQRKVSGQSGCTRTTTNGNNTYLECNVCRDQQRGGRRANRSLGVSRVSVTVWSGRWADSIQRRRSGLSLDFNPHLKSLFSRINRTTDWIPIIQYLCI